MLSSRPLALGQHADARSLVGERLGGDLDALAPVGPSAYSTALAELRPTLGPGSTLVLAPEVLLREAHGRDYVVWELCGNRICVGERVRSDLRGLAGWDGRVRELDRIARVLVVDDVGARERTPQRTDAPPGFRVEAEGPGYALFEAPGARGTDPGPCPLVSDGQRAEPGAAS